MSNGDLTQHKFGLTINQKTGIYHMHLKTGDIKTCTGLWSTKNIMRHKMETNRMFLNHNNLISY